MGMVNTVVVTPQETGPNAPVVEPKPDRPAWLPEKFKTAEDLAKSYTELEKKVNPAKPEVEPTVEQPAEDAFAAFEKEFGETGKLADESYTKLQELGYSKKHVDAYIAGQQAIASQALNDVYGTVGGEENYKALTEWAAKSLSPQEIASFNASVANSDPNAVKLAIEGLNSRYTAKHGKSPVLLGGKPGSASQPAFRSISEMTAAMSDPRYAADSAYRADVIKRIEGM